MSTFGTFLLAVAGFIGTLMLINDPTQKLMKWARGKKESELKAQAKSWVDEHDASEVVGKGCGFIFFIFLSLLYKFVVMPLAVLSALVNKIGYQPVAYVMLAIVALSWLLSWLQFARTKKSSQPTGVVAMQEGKRVEGVAVQTDEEIKLPNPSWTFVRRVFFSLPTLYLWYLFLVVIGVL